MMQAEPTLVRMTRRVAFSSGHRYWLANLSEEENRERFGQWASPYNHGHNYALEVTVQGPVDPLTGMVVNIKRIDDVLQDRVVRAFDGRSLNDEVAYFSEHAPSLENLSGYIESLVKPELPKEVELIGLKVEETPTLYAERQPSTDGLVSLTRTYEFAASHRLHSPALSDAENLELFGKCNNAAGHGHNYLLEVTVSGKPDPRTGMIADIAEIDQVVEERVVDRYDHKNLSVDLPEFEGSIASSENIVLHIFNALSGCLPARLTRVRLHETARNVFEVSA